MDRKWILASASPRRKEILQKMGMEFEIIPAQGEEKITAEKPEETVMELALHKAREVADRLGCKEKTTVIGADTVVVCDGCILGKPKDREEARATLMMLSGRTHQVYTGVALVLMPEKKEYVFYEKTDVSMYDISPEEIKEYVESGEPMDKAGSYGIQGKGGMFVSGIQGDYNNVVGLPAARLYHEIKKIR